MTEDERDWVDEGYARLSKMLGRSRMLECQVVLPTNEFFPDPYDGTETALEKMFRRVCKYMGVDRTAVELSLIPDANEVADLLPEYRYSSSDAAGLHFGRTPDELALIGLKASFLKDPLGAVATLAHELGHVVLLDGGHMDRDLEDMEPMTDLVTVFLGMGIFTANTSRRFKQFQDDRRQGWSTKHQGYLPEVVFAYALARFAKERGELKPAWTDHLSTNLKTWFRQSAAWLERPAR